MTDPSLPRRHYLRVAGIVAGVGLAGCSETPDADTPTETTETPTDTPTATPTATETPEETTVEPTETPTPEPDPAVQHIADAEAALEHAHEAFLSFAGLNADLLTVNSSTEGVTLSPVINHVEDARDALTKAAREDDGAHEATITEFEALADALESITVIEARVTSAYARLVPLLEAFYEQEYETTDAERETIGRELRASRTTFRKLAEQDATVVGAPGIISPERFAAKRDQFRAEYAAFDTLLGVLNPIRTQVGEFESGVETFREPNYTSAWSTFWSISRDLEEPLETLTEAEPPEHFAGFVSTLSCYADAIARAAVELEKAANAGREDDDRAVEEHEQNARDILDTADCGVAIALL